MSNKLDQPVDMIEIARQTTKRDIERSCPGAIKVIAPAKVNLFLGIGDRRPDGYHDCLNIMHSLMLHDVLYMRLGPAVLPAGVMPMVPVPEEEADGGAGDGAGDGLRIRLACIGCEGIPVPDCAPEQNLAYKAVRALADEFGLGAGQAMEIRVEKHIPSQAGLGGGSADCAAALVGAAKLWNLDMDDAGTAARVEKIAQKLGADVAFFLQGGCAQLSGTGEIFDRALPVRRDSIVLVKPEGGLSTGAVYRAFDEVERPVSEEHLAGAQASAAAADVALFNNLAAPAESLQQELAEVRAWLEEQPGACDVLLCGSGATTFAICDTLNSASLIAAAARQRGWWSRTTAFGPLKASVVPSRR